MSSGNSKEKQVIRFEDESFPLPGYYTGLFFLIVKTYDQVMNYKTLGIVVKRMNYGEADRILTIFTERFGKIKAIAKGVRKISSKMAGSLEPFALVNLQLYQGKNLYIVTGATIKQEFGVVDCTLKKTSHCFYLGELIDKFTEENQKNPEIFNLLVDVLWLLRDEESCFWLRVFELKLIRLSGFHPELFVCVHCRETIIESSNYWDSVEGGLICPACQDKFHHGKEISNNLIKYFRFIVRSELKNIKNLKIPKMLEKEAEKILEEYLESVLEREIKSRKFLQQVCL